MSNPRKTQRPAASPAPPAPKGVVKASPSGKKYRIFTIPLADLPAFLASSGYVPKTYFYYAPEGEEVLGVRKQGETEEREL